MTRKPLPEPNLSVLPKATSDDSLHLCVTSGVLHMLGLRKTASLSQLTRQLGKNPLPSDCTVHLLRQGATIHDIGLFDLGAYAQSGMAYVRRFYNKIWDDEWEKFWAEDVANNLTKIKDQATFLRSHSRFSQELRKPTWRDVVRALDGTQVVSALLHPRGASKATTGVYPIVCYEWRSASDSLLCYSPQSGPYGFIMEQAQFSRRWLRDEGISIVSR